MYDLGFLPKGSLLKKLLWLKAVALSAASAIIKTVTGTAPITLTNAVHHAFVSLTQYGKCEQRNLPKGYTELDYIQSDGSQYIDLNTTLDQDDTIEIEFELTASQNSRNIFGYRGGASSNNIMLFLGGTNNRVFIDFNNSDYAPYRLSCDCTVGTKYKAVISKSRRAFLATDGTVLAENTTLCEDTIACPSAYLFHASGTPAYNSMGLVKIYSCKITGKRNLVGAKDASNVVEMYDKVSDAPFVNAGTGTFTAGPNATPTPGRPMDIWCNNGVLRYSANMANVNAQTALVGYYISAQGVVTADTNNWIYQAFIPCKPNTTYTLSMSTPVYYVTVSEYSTAEDSGFVVRKNGSTGTNNSLTITTGANTNFIRFGTNIDRAAVTLEEVLGINWMLNLGGAAMDYQPYVEGGIYVDGTPEVLTVSENFIDYTFCVDRSKNGIVTVKQADGSIKVTGTWNGYRFWSGTDNMNLMLPAGTYTLSAHLGIQALGGGNATGTFTIAEETTYQNAFFYGTNGEAIDTYLFPKLYRPSEAQTVNDIPMLLSVGDIKDKVELVGGPKTVRIGVKVLTGDNTKDGAWGTSGGASNLYSLTIANSSTDNSFAPMCTHLVGVLGNVGYASIQDGQFKHGSNSNVYYFKDTSSEDVAAFKAKLAAAHASGNPYIVLYPLAAETTEQGTPHALHSYEGTTIVGAVTNVDPVTLTCEYEGVGE